jgi:hypothetical protein
MDTSEARAMFFSGFFWEPWDIEAAHVRGDEFFTIREVSDKWVYRGCDIGDGGSRYHKVSCGACVSDGLVDVNVDAPCIAYRVVGRASGLFRILLGICSCGWGCLVGWVAVEAIVNAHCHIVIVMCILIVVVVVVRMGGLRFYWIHVC